MTKLSDGRSAVSAHQSKQDLAVDALRKGYSLVAVTEPITLVVHHPRTDGDENRSTVLYGDEDAEAHEDKFGDCGDPEEENEFNLVSSDEDRGGDWTDDDQEIGRKRPPYDPDDPDDPRNF